MTADDFFRAWLVSIDLRRFRRSKVGKPRKDGERPANRIATL